MDLEVLRKIGLSDGEVKVYKALLELGATSINHIHEKVGIDRRNIYDILNKLIERGLASYFDENKKRIFRVSNPDKLISYIEEKKSGLDEVKKDINKILPDVKQAFNSKKEELKAEVFRGIEGIKAVWEDSLNYKETFWIGSGRYIPKGYPNFFIPWNKRRIEKKVKWYNLMRYELRKETKGDTLEELKFLPPEFSGTPTVICIFGNKVVNFILGGELFAFVIESKELAENYKAYHKYLWNNVARK